MLMTIWSGLHSRSLTAVSQTCETAADLSVLTGHLMDPDLRKRIPADWPDIRREATDQKLSGGITGSRTACPLRARSDSELGRFTVTRGQADALPICVGAAQHARTRSLPSWGSGDDARDRAPDVPPDGRQQPTIGTSTSARTRRRTGRWHAKSRRGQTRSA
jgi:hypothetical protein